MARPQNAAANKLSEDQTGRQPGELARLRVLKGPSRGSVLVITNSRASIGRGEENDLMISDLKASRIHAEVVSSPSGWMIKDLNSANGLLFNGTVSKSAKLKTGDLITIGESVLEFLSADADANLLKLVPKDAQQVDQLVQSKREAKEVVRRTLSDPFGLNSKISKSPNPAKDSKKTINLILVSAAALGIVFYGGEIFENPVRKEKKESVAAMKRDANVPADLASLLPNFEKRNSPKSAEMFFKQGFREFREKNYLRALNQFDLVLQIDPNHEMARRYRDNSKMAISQEVADHLELGKKAWTAGKLRNAKAHYEAVLRTLSSDKKDPSYVEASDQLEKLIKELEAE